MSGRIWARVFGACTVACLLTAAPAARADDDPTTTAAARERFKEGVGYFDQKQYEKARAAFLQAYALKKHPAVLLNLAQSEVRSGHERDAAKHFAQYLREANEASAAERESAESGLNTARAAVIEIRVTVDEPGAEVFVDGTLEGNAPLSDPVYVEPGSHSLEAKKGERSATQNVSGKAGDKRELRLALAAPAPVTPAVAPEQKPKAEPEDNGAGEPAEPEGSGREPFFRWVTTRPLGFIPAGATVLLGLGAGGFAIGSTIRYNDADSTADAINKAAREDKVSTRGICRDPAAAVASSSEWMSATPLERDDRTQQYKDACDRHQGYVDDGDTFKTVALGLGIGAGVTAITTVVLYFTTAPKAGESARARDASPSVAIVPWVTPGEGGLVVLGQF